MRAGALLTALLVLGAVLALHPAGALAQAEEDEQELLAPEGIPAHPGTVTRLTHPGPRVMWPLQIPALDRPRTRDAGGPRRMEVREVEANVYPWLPATNAGVAIPQVRPTAPSQAENVTAFSYQPRMTTSFRANVQNGSVPGDCRIAVGNDHVITVTNTLVQVWSKAGDSLFVATLEGFFQSPAGYKGCFDPKVVYDETAGRFYMMCLDRHPTLAESVFEVAISSTGNPLDPWYLYEFRNELDNRGIDYEELGYGPRGLYICGNYVSNAVFTGWPAPGPAHATTLWVLDKAAMLAGNSVTFYRIDDTQGNDSFLYTPKVAIVHDVAPAGIDGFMVAFDGLNGNPSLMKLLVYGITLPGNFPASGPALSLQHVETANAGTVPNAPQAGGPAQVQANNLGAPPIMAAYRSGHLYVSTHFPLAGAISARVYDVTVASWPGLSLAVLDVPAGSETDFWTAVEVNIDRAIGAGFCRSSGAMWPSAVWSLRQEDATGFTTASTLKSGEAYYGNSLTDTPATLYRWGDYSGVAVDPVSQGFWFYNMYSTASGTTPLWRSWVGYVPRAVYVDVSYGGAEAGSRTRPWNTFNEGYLDARDDNDLVIRPATFPGPTTITKRVTIIADGGTVQFGP